MTAAVVDAKAGLRLSATVVSKLRQYAELGESDVLEFCRCLYLCGSQRSLWDQQRDLVADLGDYLAATDNDAAESLVTLVAKRAGSAGAHNNAIRRVDVLHALGTEEDRLYPAVCKIETPENPVAREQEEEIAQAIIDASGGPVILHASGGVGKSVIATRIGNLLPIGSKTVVYDCFGGGSYRNASRPRHRAADLCPQVANELSGDALCLPLVPRPNEGPHDLARGLLARLTRAPSAVRSTNPQALVCLVVDAADNAQLAAEAEGDKQSFPRALLREQMPDGVRLVALCRTHRITSLDPPPTAVSIELRPFSLAESTANLRRTFPHALDADAHEFHRLTSQNPRVQAAALAQTGGLRSVLTWLGPAPMSAEDAIARSLDTAIRSFRDSACQIERGGIESLCALLAVLRPPIPIDLLAEAAGTAAGLVRSFISDLGRPLLVSGESVQFRDEPTETFFQNKFKPVGGDLAAFIARLRPLAPGSAYIAAALPRLLLEAGKTDDLIALALSDDALPSNAVECATLSPSACSSRSKPPCASIAISTPRSLHSRPATKQLPKTAWFNCSRRTPTSPLASSTPADNRKSLLGGHSARHGRAVPNAEQPATWASLATAAGAEPDFETGVFQLIVQEMGLSEGGAQRAHLTDRREQLRQFITLATEGEALLSHQIDGAPSDARKIHKRNRSPARGFAQYSVPAQK